VGVEKSGEMEIRRIDLDEWERRLPSRGIEVFHRPEALSVLDEHSSWTLRLLGAYKGDQPVGLLPAFERSASVGRAVASPPPGFGVPRMGPVLMPASPKRRKRERVNRRFVDSVMEHLDLDRRTTILRMVLSTHHGDPRPYEWRSMRVSAAFTYRLEPDDLEQTMASFSKSLRREIRDGRELDVTVGREPGSVQRVYRDARERYDEQGERLGFSLEYVEDLVDALGGSARTYVARDGRGEYLGGIVSLFSTDAAYFWLGGASNNFEGTSLNGLLHWTVIEDVATDPPNDSVTAYDLVGANTERLCKYKAKFGGDLIPYYEVESRSRLTQLAKKTYRLTGRS
jgi:hypothetical protein